MRFLAIKYSYSLSLGRLPLTPIPAALPAVTISLTTASVDAPVLQPPLPPPPPLLLSPPLPVPLSSFFSSCASCPLFSLPLLLLHTPVPPPSPLLHPLSPCCCLRYYPRFRPRCHPRCRCCCRPRSKQISTAAHPGMLKYASDIYDRYRDLAVTSLSDGTDA